MKNLIIKLDLFGKPLRLRLGKQVNKTTLFGGFLSLITYLIISISFIFKILEFFNKSDPYVGFEIYRSTSPKGMNLTEQSLDFIFTLVDSKTFKVVEDIHTYFDIEILYTRYSKFEFTNVKKDKYIVDKRNCSELEESNHIYENLNKFNKKLINNSICMGNELKDSNQDIILNGTFLDNNFTQLSVTIYKCNQTQKFLRNSTIKCKSDEEIKKIRETSFLELFFVDLNVFNENYTDPRDIYLANLYWRLSSSASFITYLTFKNIEILTTNNGLFNLVYDYMNFYSFDHFENVENQSTQEYIDDIAGVIYITPSLKNEAYTRDYLELDEIAASIAGLFSSLILIGNIITIIPYEFDFYENFIDHVWSYDYDESQNLNFIVQNFNKDQIKENHNIKKSYKRLNLSTFRTIHNNSNIEFNEIPNNLNFNKSRQIFNSHLLKKKKILFMI